MTDQGTILLSGRTVKQFDLSKYGGPSNGWVLDSLFYEVDIATNEVLMRWSPLEHLDQFDSLAANVGGLQGKRTGRSKNTPWDYFHLNSVARVPDPMSGFIISARPLSAVLKLDNDGNIEWVVGVRILSPSILFLGADISTRATTAPTRFLLVQSSTINMMPCPLMQRRMF